MPCLRGAPLIPGMLEAQKAQGMGRNPRQIAIAAQSKSTHTTKNGMRSGVGQQLDRGGRRATTSTAAGSVAQVLDHHWRDRQDLNQLKAQRIWVLAPQQGAAAAAAPGHCPYAVPGGLKPGPSLEEATAAQSCD